MTTPNESPEPNYEEGKMDIRTSKKLTEIMTEMALDRRAADHAFEAAQVRYHNALSRLAGVEKAFWDKASKKYDLDPQEEAYTAKYNQITGRYHIRLKAE